ncbi:MAG: type II toxin-antitoxin system VapB family antitoxin [Terrimicrobiaceae bacterium]
MHFDAIFTFMRISVDISEEILNEVMELTGEKSKSASLAKAVNEFVRRKRAKEFGRLMREGAFDYPTESTSESLANPVPPLATE